MKFLRSTKGYYLLSQKRNEDISQMLNNQLRVVALKYKAVEQKGCWQTKEKMDFEMGQLGPSQYSNEEEKEVLNYLLYFGISSV